MIYDASLDALLQKVWDGQRINPAEARRLYSLPLEELCALADRRWQLAKADAYNGRGNQIVTYNIKGSPIKAVVNGKKLVRSRFFCERVSPRIVTLFIFIFRLRDCVVPRFPASAMFGKH